MAETDQEREDRYARERRAEANSLAHDANPMQAGEELADGSDAREAKLKLKRDAAKEQAKDKKA